MTTTDAVVAIIVALFAAGGPLAVLINARAAKKPEITSDQAETKAVEVTSSTMGIEDRWQNYADQIEKRLNARLDKLYEELVEAQNSRDKALIRIDALFRYVDLLRNHIYKRLEPPPPDWPDDIH